MANLTLCESFERDEDTKDLCYDRIYDVEENATICPLFNSPKKKIRCYQEAAESTYDFRYCDAIRKEVDVSLCKDLGLEECDTTAHLNEVVEECKAEAALGQRRDKCNAYSNELSADFAEGETGELVFKRDDPSKETFKVEVASVDLTLGVATVKLTAMGRSVPYNVRVGNILTHEFVNMYVVNLWKEEQEEAEEGETPAPAAEKAELCFFREPKREEQKEAEEETEEEDGLMVTVNVTPPEPESAEAEEAEEPEEELEEEMAEPPREGFLRRAIRWFWGLFGIGK
jgi:hypothetical protein